MRRPDGDVGLFRVRRLPAETAGFLAKAGLSWTTDVNLCRSLAIQIQTAHAATIAGVPRRIFPYNRVLRAIRASSTTPT